MEKVTCDYPCNSSGEKMGNCTETLFRIDGICIKLCTRLFCLHIEYALLTNPVCSRFNLGVHQK